MGWKEAGGGVGGNVATLIATIPYFTVIIVKKIALKILEAGSA